MGEIRLSPDLRTNNGTQMWAATAHIDGQPYDWIGHGPDIEAALFLLCEKLLKIIEESHA